MSGQITMAGETIRYAVRGLTDRSGTVRHYLRAYVPLGKDPETGKTLKKEVTAPTEELLRKKVLAIQHARPLQDEDLTLAQYLERWIERNDFCYSPTTIRNMRTYARRMAAAIGTRHLWELDDAILRDFYRRYQEKHGPIQARVCLTTLNRPFNDAVAQHLLYANPQLLIHIPRTQRREIVPLTQAQAHELLELCKEDERCGAAIACTLLLGLRISECVGLAVDDYDPINRTLRIHRQIIEVPGSGALRPTTKGRRERVLRPSALACAWLDRQLQNEESYRRKAGSRWHNTYGCLFTDAKGHHLVHETLRIHLHRMCGAIGRKDFRFHHLRHTCATIIQNQPDGLTIARDVLGHKYFETTSRYLHATPDQMAAALEAVSAFASST